MKPDFVIVDLKNLKVRVDTFSRRCEILRTNNSFGQIDIPFNLISNWLQFPFDQT